MADNKVNFLRGTSAEYETKTKDNDTFYYTTDTKKLYLGETEITGIEIDDTSTTATDKTWSAKKISDSIPTTLPADGGNADTVDGLHASDFFNNIAGIITPESSGKETLAEYIHSINSSTSNFYASSFDDLPTNNWGYNVTVYKVGGAVYVIAYRALSNSEIYVRCFTGSGEWNGDWTRLNDGGNAATVNGLTVQTAVPANAKFTDTTYGVATTSVNGLMSSTDKSKLDGIATGANKYTHPSYTARTGVPTANVAPAFGGTFTVSQPVSDATGHITAINSRTITIPSTVASASAAGLVSTGAQTFAGNKTFNGQIIPAGASDVTIAQARKIYAGTADITAGTTALTTGVIYLVYE